MDGLTATREIRQRGFRNPIIAATASFSQADKDDCVAAGMDDVLPKPFTRSAVLAMLEKHVDASRPPAAPGSMHCF
jgi:two-component system, sensor histidine kinase